MKASTIIIIIVVIILLISGYFLYQKNQKEKQRQQLIDLIFTTKPNIDVSRDFFKDKDIIYLQDVLNGKIR